MTHTDIIVCGAGPTGLYLALELHRNGVPTENLVILEQRPEPEFHDRTKSKALGIHARTIEALEHSGLFEVFQKRCLAFNAASIRDSKGDESAFLEVSSSIDSKFNFVWSLPQYETEEILYTKCGEKGIKIEWNTKVESVTQDVQGVTLNCKRKDNDVIYRCKWLAGCDGGHSVVRTSMGLDFIGENLKTPFVMASVKIDSDKFALDQVLAAIGDSVLVSIPEPKQRARLIFNWNPANELPEELTLEFFQQLLNKNVPNIECTISEPRWLTKFFIHERLISSFRDRRIFFAGDAAHTHSPVGGMGMNTGMQDAYNLAWKLSLVYHGIGRSSLLDTYNEERRPVAESLVKNTTMQTKMVSSTNPIFNTIRKTLVSSVLPMKIVQDAINPSIGMLDLSYSHSSLSQPSSMMRFISRPKVSSGDFITKVALSGILFCNHDNGPFDHSSDLKSLTSFSKGFILLVLGGFDSPEETIDKMNNLAKSVRESGYPKEQSVLSICGVVQQEHANNAATDDCKALFDTMGIDTNDNGIHNKFEVYGDCTMILIRPDWHLARKSNDAKPLLEYLQKFILA